MSLHSMNMYTVCTLYIPGQSIHIPVVPTGFRGQHRDGVWSDLPLPSSAREDEDEGSPCPEDGDFFDARPDVTETEEAISKLSVAWSARSNLVLKGCILCSAICQFLAPQLATKCHMLQHWKEVFFR